MSQVQLYFPATIMLQYVNADDIGNLVSKIDSNVTRVLEVFLIHDPTLDTHTTLTISPTLKRYYIGLIRRLQGMRLGVDVVLYIIKDSPLEVDLSGISQIMLTEDPYINKKLKIRRSVVAQRIFLTDLVFKFYYYVVDNYAEIVELFKEIQSLLRKVTSFRQCDRAYSIIRGALGSPRVSSEGAVMTIWFPHELWGFVGQNFFGLGLPDVVRLGLLWHLATGMYCDYFPSGRHPYFDNIEPIANEAEQMLEERMTRILAKLRQVALEVKGVVEEVSPVEEFLQRSLPSTHVELFLKAQREGIDLQELVRTLDLYIRWGRVVSRGEVLEWAITSKEVIKRREGHGSVQRDFEWRV